MRLGSYFAGVLCCGLSLCLLGGVFRGVFAFFVLRIVWCIHVAQGGALYYISPVFGAGFFLVFGGFLVVYAMFVVCYLHTVFSRYGRCAFPGFRTSLLHVRRYGSILSRFCELYPAIGARPVFPMFRGCCAPYSSCLYPDCFVFEFGCSFARGWRLRRGRFLGLLCTSSSHDCVLVISPRAGELRIMRFFYIQYGGNSLGCRNPPTHLIFLFCCAMCLGVFFLFLG